MCMLRQHPDVTYVHSRANALCCVQDWNWGSGKERQGGAHGAEEESETYEVGAAAKTLNSNPYHDSNFNSDSSGK